MKAILHGPSLFKWAKAWKIKNGLPAARTNYLKLQEILKHKHGVTECSIILDIDPARDTQKQLVENLEQAGMNVVTNNYQDNASVVSLTSEVEREPENFIVLVSDVTMIPYCEKNQVPVLTLECATPTKWNGLETVEFLSDEHAQEIMSN